MTGDQEETATLAAAIVWVGASIGPNQVDILNDHGVEDPQPELINDDSTSPESVLANQPKDGSKYCQRYELTFKGEPICITEYATRIAGRMNTHVIQIDDFQWEAQQDLRSSLVAPNSEFHELVLTERKGRKRHTFTYDTSITKLHQLFTSEIKKGIEVFQIPYIFDVNGAGGKMNWATAKAE